MIETLRRGRWENLLPLSLRIFQGQNCPIQFYHFQRELQRRTGHYFRSVSISVIPFSVRFYFIALYIKAHPVACQKMISPLRLQYKRKTTSPSQHTMVLAIPKLEDYGLAETGFMPAEQPLKRIEGVYYSAWENIMDQFHQLLDTKQLRYAVLNVHPHELSDISFPFSLPNTSKLFRRRDGRT